MSMANPPPWQLVPFHFWSVALFLLGSIVGSFLNVCIHRMPRGESVVTPPSHCPHCRYSIPWYLNIPLVTWPMLGGKCKNCAAPISIRYFLVELLTAVLFLSCWLAVGQRSPPLALVYCLLLAGFIVATFIDVEHFIIPDEITLGGVAAGVGCSFLVPALHGAPTAALSLERCFAGAIAGAGLVYGILRLGKLLYGRQKFELAPGSKVFFTETTVKLPDELDARLRHEADRRGTTVSEVTRAAIESHLGGGRRRLIAAKAGRSGRRDTARRIEEILRREARRSR